MAIKSINSLRMILKQNRSFITQDPGVYVWWFDKAGRDLILEELPNVELGKLKKRVIDGVDYWALYFGISSNLRMRLNWHINQKHTASNVSNGYLSTFRQTMSALLKRNMSDSEDIINDFINEHCLWEWEATKTKNEAEHRESQELTANYYPLNLSKNKSVDKNTTTKLKELRKQFRQ